MHRLRPSGLGVSTYAGVSRTKPRCGEWCPGQVKSRYEHLEGGDRMFKIVGVASGAGIGSVGFWAREWRGGQVWEIGWSVLPELQRRGGGDGAGDRARQARSRPPFPARVPIGRERAVEAICRKLGFQLLGACEFEYPKRHFMSCNDWQLDLSS